MNIQKTEIFPGITIYSNIFTPSMNIVDRLENAVSTSNRRKDWQKATVNTKDLYSKHRDCFDIKIKKINRPFKTKYELEFDEIWQEAYDAQLVAVNEYTSKYKIQMKHWEAMNFIKYNKGQYFTQHADHGHSYICTVSLVAYLNDDYEGGELYFNNLDIKLKPKAGDLIIFPSSYLFSHTAMPIISGTKYVIATMLDYKDNNGFKHE